jgi:iron complex outermembrane receptor protein
MKTIKCRKMKSLLQLRSLLVAGCLLLPLIAVAQSKIVQGTVVDEFDEPIIGCVVRVAGTTIGMITDVDGKYTIEVPGGNNQLEFSFLGCETQLVTVGGELIINVKLRTDVQLISEVVVIGYGTQKKKDLTGSIAVISEKDFNRGMVNSPEQLINGKIAGVQIMSNGGSPSAGSSIRIRGGASLNASNDPLIVLDGVPLESGGISGNSSNFLSLINPNDIESMTVLKDASSTAIYGSRASNGVLIITTKKGNNDGIKINFSTTNSVQTKTKSADMLSIEQFKNVVQTQGTTLQQALLGSSTTDWNEIIFQDAFGTDNNISLAGKIKGKLPFRTSIGVYQQEGILKTDQANRYTGNLSLTPSFLKDHLKLNLNLKASMNNNQFADAAAVYNAATFNPTIPVYSNSTLYGGYNEAVDQDGNLITRAVLNPLGMLEERQSTSDIGRVIGNVDVDYKVQSVPELKGHLTIGYDYAQGKGKVLVPQEAAYNFASGGRNYTYGPQTKENRLLTGYLNYNKTIKDKNTFDATAGYDYQFWKSTTNAYEELNANGNSQASFAPEDQRHALISFYARVNYSFDSRYMLTATVRQDGTSRFNSHNRWGTFPSVAVAWRAAEEKFLKNVPFISDLKLRGSYGVTGQQDGIGNYNYLPIYTLSQDGALYRLGDQYYYTYRPEAYNNDLKWESSVAYNAGLDFGFLKGKISGTVDIYTRQTKNLLAVVPTAAGTNFDKTIMSNVGNVNSQGWEVALTGILLDNKNTTWSVAFNITHQQVQIDNLALAQGAQTIVSTPAGPTIDNTYIQVLTEGYAPYMFYVYKQLYDQASGKPIEGAYASLDGNNDINSNDLYHYHSPAPDLLLGLSSQLRYKKWNASIGLRANTGNYVYNGMAMNTGALGTLAYNDFQLNNLHKSFLKTGFKTRQYLSDYYVENAAFLKLDNISAGYDFGEIFKNVSLNASALVQNVFTWTNYSGVDPEVPSGFDNSFYPRPTTFSISLGLQF